MSNQENGFQGSVPFIQDKEFQYMFLDQIKHLLEQEKKELKKDYNELEERKRLIKEYQRIQKARKKIRKGIDIKKEYREKRKKKEKKKVKSFEEYFEECIKNRQIPPDTPSYMRKALERAMKDYDQGLKKEKSALKEFASKYIVLYI